MHENNLWNTAWVNFLVFEVELVTLFNVSDKSIFDLRSDIHWNGHAIAMYYIVKFNSEYEYIQILSNSTGKCSQLLAIYGTLNDWSAIWSRPVFDIYFTEDIDPSVGRFRNMVQTTVIPSKVNDYY